MAIVGTGARSAIIGPNEWVYARVLELISLTTLFKGALTTVATMVCWLWAGEVGQ